jgi:molybdopterin-synthase adenylyltransferase
MDPTYYSLRPDVTPCITADGSEIIFVQNGSGRRSVYQHSQDFQALVCAIADPVTVDAVANDVDVPRSLAQETIKMLVDDEVAWRAEAPGALRGLSRENWQSLTYWSRSTSSQIEACRMMQNVSESHVVVIGLGGLGSWVCLQLAMAGVRRLTLIDHDSVDQSNLTRQPIYTLSHLGLPKVVAAKDSLISRFDSLSISVHQESISHGEPSSIGSDVDLIMGCGDEPNAQEFSLVLNDIAQSRSLGYIAGGRYSGHFGRIGMSVLPSIDACANCLALRYSTMREAGMKPLYTRAHMEGTTAAIAADVASTHVTEALNILSGSEQRILRGRVGAIDPCSSDVEWTAIDLQDQCPYHQQGT